MSDVSRLYEQILNPGGGLYTGKPSTTQYFPRDAGQTYGYNVNGTYEQKRPGEAYVSIPAPRFPAPSAPPTALAAIQQQAPAATLPAPGPAMALAPPAARQAPAVATRPISNTGGQMRGPTLFDLLSGGGGKSSTLGMLLAGLGGGPSSSRSSSPGSYFSVATGGNSSEGGIEGNGGITGYY